MHFPPPSLPLVIILAMMIFVQHSATVFNVKSIIFAMQFAVCINLSRLTDLLQIRMCGKKIPVLKVCCLSHVSESMEVKCINAVKQCGDAIYLQRFILFLSLCLNSGIEK